MKTLSFLTGFITVLSLTAAPTFALSHKDLLTNARKYKRYSPEKKARLKKLYGRYNKLPHGKKKKVKSRLRQR